MNRLSAIAPKLEDATMENLIMIDNTFLPTTTEPIPYQFDAYVDYWLSSYKKDEIKTASYARLLETKRVFSAFAIAQMPVATITIRDIKKYLNEVVEMGYAMNTVKKLLQIVTAPLKFAVANRWIIGDPTAGLRIPSNLRIKKPAKEVIVYEDDEYEALRASLDAWKIDAHCAVLLMLEMGLRPGEVIALDWDDINLQKRTIHIHKTCVRDIATNTFFIQDEPKSRSSNRVLPMTAYVNSMMEHLFENRPLENAFIFHDCRGARMSYQALRYQCRKECERISVPYRGLHVFRHTFATHQYYKGTSVKILSKILGHANATITHKFYIHLYGDVLEEMREAME